MEKVFEELLKLIQINKLFVWLGFSEEISLAISSFVSAIIVALLIYLFHKLYKRFQVSKTAKDLAPYFNDENDINNKLSLFIETWGQEKLPSREDEPIETHQTVLNTSKLIPHFIEKVFNGNTGGKKFFIVLGDSGMGKTTFLINLYVRYQSFFTRGRKYKIKIFPFGYRGEILDKIKELPDTEKKETIVLLDAFDEYKKLLPPDIPDGLSDDERFRKVLDEVIEAVQDFRKVVFTSRTQYFPGEDTNDYQLTIPTFDNSGFHILDKFYISPFKEKDIRRYLNKKYGYIRFWNYEKKAKALKIVITDTKLLLVRPMLLSYIDLLVNRDKVYTNTWDVYETLINEWITRECNKREHSHINRQKLKDLLHEYSQKIAVKIYEHRKEKQIVSLTKEEATNNINVALEDYRITGQSLLTRDAENNWKFSHRSILEFFIAKEAIENQEFASKLDVTNLDMLKKFCREKGLGYLFDYVLIKGGEFTMGSPDDEVSRRSDETQHRVRVSDFYMAKFAVTVADFGLFIAESGHKTDAENGDGSYVWNGKKWKNKAGINWRHGVDGQLRPEKEMNHPVLHVSWNDTDAYSKWLTAKTGKTFRLPTEAEWEYACRAGTTTPYNTGASITTAKANYEGKGTVAVDSFVPNAWGLYNMHGNVWEWCSDCYSEKYYEECEAKGVVENPECKELGSCRVLRGGCWRSGAGYCRSANRYGYPPGYRYNFVGFRLVFVP